MELKPSMLRDLMQPTFLWMVAASVVTGAIWAKRLDDRVAYMEAFSAQITALRAQTDTQAVLVAAIGAQLVSIHDALIEGDRRNTEALREMQEGQRALDQRLQTQFNTLLGRGRVAP